MVYYCNYHYSVSRLCNLGYVSFILWFIKDFITLHKMQKKNSANIQLY